VLVHHWSHATTPAGAGWDTVIAGSVQLVTEKGFAARAALGEAEVIGVIVDDPDGAYDFKTLHRWYMVEDETPGDQLVWNGYVGDQVISRGADSGIVFPHGAGRRWELELVQENTILGFRVVTGSDGKRPAETASARLTWLLGSSYLSTVHDHGLVDWSGLANFAMDAVDYRGQSAADVLRDISLITGYNHYARYRDVSSDIEIAFYEPNVSALDSVTLRISNDSADLSPTGDYDSTLVYAPTLDVRLRRMGSRVAAGVYVPGNGVSSYGYDLATSYEFGFRDMAAPTATVNTQATADALRGRLLAQHSEQDERIENLRIRVSAANLNAVRHGQAIQAKFTHGPGWTSYRWARVVSRTFGRPEGETQAFYDVDLELSSQGPSVAHILYAYVVSQGSQPIDHSTNPWTCLYWSGDFANPAQSPGPGVGQSMGLYRRALVGGESGTCLTMESAGYSAAWVVRVAGVDVAGETLVSGVDTISPDGVTASIVPPSAGTASVFLGGMSLQCVGYGEAFVVTPSAGTEIVDANRINSTAGGVCKTGSNTAPPWNWIAWRQGTGVLTLSGAVCFGSNPGYNLCGRGYAGVVLPIIGRFGISAPTHGTDALPGGTFTVALPSPPG